MTAIITKIRIESNSGHVDVFTSFEHILDLFESGDWASKDIVIGSRLELEGVKYEVLEIQTQFRLNHLSTGNPDYDYMLEIVYRVKQVD